MSGDIKEHKYWIDNLRVFSLLGVVILHVTPNLVFETGISTGSYNWWVSNIYTSLFRFCVPVFVMMTGALLLGRRIEIFDFIMKKTLRIILPFAFWSIIYILYDIQVNIQGKQSGVQILKIFIDEIIHGSSFHLWYVYMIIGLYLLIPVLNKWIIHSEKTELGYFLVIWLITTFLNLPYFKKFGIQNYIYYFNGYIGYLVLGYVLSSGHLLIKKRKTLYISSLMIISGIILTVFGTLYFTLKNGSFQNFLYDYLSPNIVLCSSGLFLLFRCFLNNETCSVYHVSEQLLLRGYTFAIY